MTNFFDGHTRDIYDLVTVMPSRSEISSRSEGVVMTEMMSTKEIVNKNFHKSFVFSDGFHLGNKVNIFRYLSKN